MELLETQDPERRRLIETSDRHKRELENEIQEISTKTEKILTNALIIGGSLALTYFVVSQLTSKSRKTKKRKEGAKSEKIEEEFEADEPSVVTSMIAQIGGKLIDQATLVLLDIAKEKLSEYLVSKKREDS